LHCIVRQWNASPSAAGRRISAARLVAACDMSDSIPSIGAAGIFPF
jgi:hypothetical protein